MRPDSDNEQARNGRNNFAEFAGFFFYGPDQAGQTGTHLNY